MLYPLKIQKRVPVLVTLVLCFTCSVPAIAQSSVTPNQPEDRIDPRTERAIATRLSPQLLRPSYILGAGDQIQINVFGYEEYTGPQVILPDGTIILPLIGSITAGGQTVAQLTQELTNRLNPLLVDPVVTISLTTLRPVVVNVAGEVQRPGPVQLRSLTTTDAVIRDNSIAATPTVSAALIEAGGITQHADLRQVILRRYSPTNESEPMVINLWDAIGSDNPPPDITLQDGDSIYVSRLEPGEVFDTRLAARSSIAPETVRVRVVGEVVSPGEVQVTPNSSISSAVAIAGGPTDDARLSRVAFVRMNDQGVIEREIVDLRNLTDTYQIQEGDVIIVPERDDSSILDFAGRLLSPLNLLMNFIDQF
jgi:polysaccharide biosynthesis/export protein